MLFSARRVIFIALTVFSATAMAADVSGAHDHPLVTRFTDSNIIGYQQVSYDKAVLPLGPLKPGSSDQFTAADVIEGRVTRIAYEAPAGKSLVEVYRNFSQALAKAGFKTRFECTGSSCGNGADFSDRVIQPLLEPMHARNAMTAALYAASGDMQQLTARLERPEGRVDVSLLVAQADEKRPVGILLQIVEAQAMATGQVNVDAKAMSQGLSQQGHIALYGIHFTTDSANLAADSDATLAQMAQLLKNEPTLKVFIVGHTDNTGELNHNLALSQQRAESVIKALTTRYGIAAQRVAAKGVASYAPVASNRDEAGRAQNRRVELVAQ
ncbi:OmpA family protein [Dyella jiangningensis]|uniref:Cell envelope biogenesis protein OmpA n=1 Tax=Dyella jiangningensis TaxID=1379159 RepID=A0A328PDF0_9GAMM|nr:OmpA family protein [Dyella jiangningensis]RAO78362.1 cell envelope biogenesis protein OmpA [Dyella jiangningensis]